MIAIPPVDERLSALWHVILDLSETAAGWTLIGGQMVFLHALEQGRTPPRVSEDVDLVVDVRARPPALAAMVEVLASTGFVAVEIDSDQISHRFARGAVTIDVLAPDGVGSRAKLNTIGAIRTIPIAGGSSALRATVRVAVRHEGRDGLVPRPSLAAAILLKARAARADKQRGPERHVNDLAFLCSLVDDPIEVREQFTVSQRRQLSRVRVLHDRGSGAWQLLGRRGADAHAAFLLLTVDA